MNVRNYVPHPSRMGGRIRRNLQKRTVLTEFEAQRLLKSCDKKAYSKFIIKLKELDASVIRRSAVKKINNL